MKTELLSPAKDKFTAFSAIDCGADAVYIGAPSFGARRAVPNSLEDIKEVVEYAHRFWAKVFVTLNTILDDKELEEAFRIALNLEEIGVDALIIQDLGLVKRLMDSGSKIPIHMSTQCDNYLPQKVKFFNDLGVSRVVLARELSLEQIKKIHKENPDLELEGFVHGALCVSMSGQCYLSQYIGGRSANRGECAQPCRKLYSVETVDGRVIKKDIHALCLKDFNASNLVSEMKEAGIFSFKIEGRLKDISYVKNITAYYREKLGKGISSGRSFYTFTPNPEKSFNRGFTQYFLQEREECFNFTSPKSKGEFLGKVVSAAQDWIKVKTDKIIHTQDGIYFEGDGFLVNKSEVISSELIKIYPNKKINVKPGVELWRNLDFEFEKEVLKPTKRQIGVRVEVANDNNLLFLNLIDEDNVSVRINFPEGEKANNIEKMKETFVRQFEKTGESDFYIEDIKIASELPFLPVSEINKLRRVAFDKLMIKRLEVYQNEHKEAQKPLKYTPYFEKEVDYRANIHNQSAKEFYEKCSVKVLEMSFESSKPNRKVALMHCKHCIKYALNICKSPEKLVLKDSFGNIYPLKFDCKKCEMFVLSD